MKLEIDREALRSVATQSALFSGLSDQQATLLLAAATMRQVQSGSVLFHQGDAPDRLIQVVSGLVRMTHIDSDGTQTTLRIVRSGGLVGCVAALQQFPYPATANAIEDLVVLTWPSSQFIELMTRHRILMENALRIVSGRTKDMVERVIEMSSKRVEQRIAASLLRLAAQAGTKTNDGIHIEFPVTRDDLAEMAGLTYFTISRTLSLWQKQGLLKGGRQRMTILDPVRVKEIAMARTPIDQA